jgi:prepilin-type N-terminal cleavage/methylation domain-containing protein
MPRDRSAGFTLIEVLVATGILVTVAAGTAQLFAIAIRHDVAARQQLAMSLAASAKLDALAASVAAAATPAAGAGAVDRAVDGFTDTIVAAGASFERRWIVAPLPAYSATAVVIVVRVLPLARSATPDFEIAGVREAGVP